MKESRKNQIKQWMLYGTLIFIALLGAFFRIKVYLINRSLWLDEAALANNLLLKHTILNNMEYAQAAPPLFKLIEIINVHLFGISEYALRFFPLICGVISTFVFAIITEKVLENPFSKIFANILFAMNYFLIYYSSEVKQYSSDVLITLIIIAAFLYIDLKKLSTKKIIAVGIALSMCFWLSHSAMLVLAGMFVVSIFTLRNEIKKWLYLILPSAVSFIPFYFLHLKTLSTNGFMQSYWHEYFLSSAANVGNIATEYLSCLFYPTFMNVFYGILITIGMLLLLKSSRKYFYIISAPLIITIIASIFHKYPIAYRLCLFLMPIFLIYVSKPLDLISKKKIPHTILIIFLTVTAFFQYFAIYPHIIMKKDLYYREEMRQLLQIVKKEKSPTDKIYIAQNGHHAFRFYNRIYKFDNNDVIIAPYEYSLPNLYTKPLITSMKPKQRYWVIFVQSSHRQEFANILYKWLEKNTKVMKRYVYYENYLFYVEKK